MKKNNNKGFTLVELLAVIVILAVVILIAVTAVIPRMNSAKEKAFRDEALAFIKAADEYTVDTNNGVKPSSICLTNLKFNSSTNNGYVDVKNGKNYKGCVVSETNGWKIYISDGKYWLDGRNATYINNSNNNVDSSFASTTVCGTSCTMTF